jgi:hypothetical protein
LQSSSLGHVSVQKTERYLRLQRSGGAATPYPCSGRLSLSLSQ